MVTRYKPPPIPIPGEYAALLGHKDRSHIYNVNAGRRHLSFRDAIMLMDLAAVDPRLQDLTLKDLLPEAEPYWDKAVQQFCKLCPQATKRCAKKRAKRGRE
jgi:hypothetical protein